MNHSKTRQLVLAAMFTAITAVAAQLIIPLGFTPVPFSMAIVAVFITGALLSPKAALLSQLAYILLGAAGFPVFSGFSGGLQKLAGPTGGYLIAYPVAALIIALVAEKWGHGVFKYAVAMFAGLAVIYTIGTIQLMLLTGSNLAAALAMAVVPFAPLDAVKVILSSLASAALYKALKRAQLVTLAI